MRLRLTVLALLTLSALLAFPAAAQDSTLVRVPTPTAADDCPEGLACVEYEGQVIEISPECGPVAAVIVSESLARTTDFSGVTESYGVQGIVLVAVGDTYEVVGEFSGPAVGALAPARFGATACLDWQEAADD